MAKKVFLIILLGLLVYGNTFFNGFVWDDEEQVVNNSAVHSLVNIPSLFAGSTFNTGGSGGLAGMYYKPVMSMFFAAIYTFSGGHAFLFHFLQVVIHILNVLLIFSLLKFFFRERVAFFLSLIFLLHPINSETVSYISALQDTIFMIFGMLALHTLRKKETGFRSFFLAGLFLLLSFLSKETGFLFAAVLLAFGYLYRQQKILAPALISLAAAGVYLFLRFVIAGVRLSASGPSPILRTTPSERLITIPKIIYTYLKDFFLPKDLAIAQHWVVQNTNWRDFYLPLLASIIFFSALTGLGVYLRKKRGTLFKAYLFFSIWFILGLGLHLQLFPLDMTFAERWFYFPMVGLLGIIGVFFSVIPHWMRDLKRLDSGSTSGMTQKVWGSRLWIILCSFLILTLSARTFIRNLDWKNGLTLFTHDVLISQDSFDLENNLGVELFRAGKMEDAQVHFEKSVQLAPYWWTSWNNLGVIFERKGDYKKASEYYQKSIDNGQYYLAYENLANIKLQQNDSEGAKIFIEESLKLLPLNSRLWFTLALANYKLSDKTGALQASRQAYLLSPTQQTYYVYSMLSQNKSLELK